MLRTFAGLVQGDVPRALFTDRRRQRAASLRALEDALPGASPGEELVLLRAFERLRAVEARLRDATDEARRAARQAELRLLAAELLAWLDERRADDAAWRLGGRDDLLRLLDDGRLDLDDARARRALDRIVCGRPGWTFAGSRGLARSVPTLHTVVGSALDRGLDVRAYLGDQLERARDGRPLLTP